LCEKIAASDSLRAKMDTVKCTLKTHDDAILTLRLEIVTQILDFDQMFYSLKNPKAQVRAFVEDSLRGRCAFLDVDEIFKAKQEIADHVRRNIQEDLQPYGILVVAVLTTDISVNSQLKVAMTAKEVAKRCLQIAIDEAETQKVKVVKEAEAHAEANHWAGIGTAKGRKNIIDGVRDSIQEFSDANPEISPQECYDTVLLLQYLQTLAGMNSEIDEHGNKKPAKEKAAKKGGEWEERFDTNTGKAYYWNHRTRVSQWARPQELDMGVNRKLQKKGNSMLHNEKLYLPIGGGSVEHLMADLKAQQQYAAIKMENNSNISVVQV